MFSDREALANHLGEAQISEYMKLREESWNNIPLDNKIDAYTFIEKEHDDLTPVTRENQSLKDLQKTWMSKIDINTMFISALNKTHFEDLKNEMYSRIKKLHEIRYPYNNFLY